MHLILQQIRFNKMNRTSAALRTHEGGPKFHRRVNNMQITCQEKWRRTNLRLLARSVPLSLIFIAFSIVRKMRGGNIEIVLKKNKMPNLLLLHEHNTSGVFCCCWDADWFPDTYTPFVRCPVRHLFNVPLVYINSCSASISASSCIQFSLLSTNTCAHKHAVSHQRGPKMRK